MHQVRDVWSSEAQEFLCWNVAQQKFNFEAADYPRYTRMIAAIPV
jgi:hypothetical protein